MVRWLRSENIRSTTQTSAGLERNDATVSSVDYMSITEAWNSTWTATDQQHVKMTSPALVETDQNTSTAISEEDSHFEVEQSGVFYVDSMFDEDVNWTRKYDAEYYVDVDDLTARNLERVDIDSGASVNPNRVTYSVSPDTSADPASSVASSGNDW